jgi:hypothetical protein
MNPTPAQSSDVKFEIGHVLFIDIVGYSKLLIKEQSGQLQTLKTIVRGTEQVRLAEAEGKLLRLPTGDGGALVFRNNLEAAVLCALEITKELQKHPGSKEKPQLRLRMGIHSGPVTRARTAFEAARAQQEKIVQAQPDYGPALCVLSIIDAALGRKDLALDEGRRAIALTPLEKDVVNASRVLQYFAITATWTGDKELALQQLKAGLRAPAASQMLSYGALKLLPFWDPLRGDPRFEKIVTSLAQKERH